MSGWSERVMGQKGFFDVERRLEAISGKGDPLVRMSARPSALPLPKPKTHFDLAEALAEGFLGGAFAGAAGLRRLRAAFRALLDLCSAVILSARALPPFRPRAEAGRRS